MAQVLQKKIKDFAKTYRFGGSIFFLCVCVSKMMQSVWRRFFWRSGIVNTQSAQYWWMALKNPINNQKTTGIALSVGFPW